MFADRYRAHVRAAAIFTAFAPAPALCASAGPLTGASGLAAGSAIVLAILGAVTFLIMTSARLSGSSLFNRLFIVVATTSAFFSAISSAVGFSLITSQESPDFFRNSILPPAFGVFVFFLAAAIWIGGAELVRHRDWFRGLNGGPIATVLHFFERSIKIFVVIPILSFILFLVSTWTTVVGIAGVDAVRHTYSGEINRLQSECAGIASWRQKDIAALTDLRQSVRDTQNAARRERESGFQTGSAGRGAVADYIEGVAQWYASVEKSASSILDADDPTGLSPFTANVCSDRIETLQTMLAGDAYANYDRWSGEFEKDFDDFAVILNRWRQDKRIENYLQSQLDAFDRANPKPVAGITDAQSRAINAFADEVTGSLKKFISAQRRSKPSPPIESAAELSPERGLDIVRALFQPAAGDAPEEEKRISRTAAVVANERIAGLSKITPRDAVLKHAKIFSDVWALGLSWDYASYVLMLAFLFFPSAERAAGEKG
ncbi:MAG: hypothetical protein R3C42_04195 [Parvularculaceae bacterium]|nr:hypothetical protein [Parvularculaceae bacterium]